MLTSDLTGQCRLYAIADLKYGTQTRSPHLHEPYYDDNQCPELGWSWEKEVFGGALGGDDLVDFDAPMIDKFNPEHFSPYRPIPGMSIGYVSDWPDTRSSIALISPTIKRAHLNSLHLP